MTGRNEGRSGDASIGGRQAPDRLYRAAFGRTHAMHDDEPRTHRGSGKRGQELVPHPWRVSDRYADERIQEKLGMYDAQKPRVGLENVSRELKEAGVPPAWRLHYITAVAHLGRVGAQTLPERLEHAQTRGR